MPETLQKHRTNSNLYKFFLTVKCEGGREGESIESTIPPFMIYSLFAGPDYRFQYDRYNNLLEKFRKNTFPILLQLLPNN